ncbi:phosphatidylserine decarboxylase [Pontibacillus halophilus JSM 076056 = DSM 19796]|uniref:phosphatidylserine decarboxylase n=1 Tax=Pontibacillus halophilus JSM 076056 = DSM 19796 TaxID=1385510 RepID=A0A0A5GGG5_9BACI|nr:phosphatidylserine decarboxylase [Pontibacillus halophilus]KGX91069.1 phosphatidylserine decarboxylase [Pontibacillus halophilus JSM 076056 = DSM 19796]
MRRQIYQSVIRLMNGRFLSSGLKRFTESKASRHLIPLYKKVLRVDMDESVQSLHEFQTLQQFFVRKLYDDARPIHNEVDVLVSPVDGVVEQFGVIKETAIEVKGQTYSVEELLDDEELAQRYKNGRFMVLYLSPSDYHRIHAPTTGTIVTQYERGATSYPVNKWGLRFGKSPISRNYRVITELAEHDGSRLAFVKVGAMWINSIELTHKGDTLNKGEEVGYFSFGSTVVLLVEKGTVQFLDEIRLQKSVRVGEAIARKESSETS